MLRIINEPTAAALAYGMDKKDGQVTRHEHTDPAAPHAPGSGRL